MGRDNVKFEGYIGTWYLIATARCKGITFYQYQSEQYGEDAPCLIVNEYGVVVLDDSYNDMGVDLGDYFDIDYDEIEVNDVD